MDGVDPIGELGLLLRTVSRDLDRRVNEVFRPLGLTVGQAEALDQIGRHGPLSLGELGTLILAEGGHPSRLVDRLVTSGLAERRSADDDRRRLEISLTPRGKRLAKAADVRMATFREWFREQTNDHDLAPAIALLWDYLDDSPLSETVRRRLELNWRRTDGSEAGQQKRKPRTQVRRRHPARRSARPTPR
jgi:MarR family transcriptional regulator, organic hydroperoxide resistance regulator